MKKEPTVGAPWCNRIDWHFTKMPDWVPYYGYTPVHPVECGYVNPNDYIGKIEVFNPYATDTDEPPVPPSMVIGVSPGPSSSKPITDPTSSGKPDFTIERLRLLDTGGAEKYRFKKTDTLCMEGKLRNIGSKGIDDDKEVKNRFLLSKGYREDAHGDWIGMASFNARGGHVEPGESHTETACVSLADKSYIQPGKVYNIVACADREEVDNNDGGKYAEEHESNNCTTEAAFEVEGTYNFLANLPALANSQPKPGEIFSYALGIGNTLDQPNEDVAVSVYMSPNQDWNGRWLVDSFMVPATSLPTGGSFWRSGNLMAPGPGEYTLWACVNPNGVIPETNGSDNCGSQWFKSGGEPNFSLSGLTISKQSFVPGERLMATVTANTSGGETPQDVEVSFWTTPRGWEQRTLVDTVVIPAQYMRESAGSVNWNSDQIPVPVPEDYTLWACINPQGTVPETNGEDNCKTTWFKVADPNPPSPVPQPEEDEGEEAWMTLMMD